MAEGAERAIHRGGGNVTVLARIGRGVLRRDRIEANCAEVGIGERARAIVVVGHGLLLRRMAGADKRQELAREKVAQPRNWAHPPVPRDAARVVTEWLVITGEHGAVRPKELPALRAACEECLVTTEPQRGSPAVNLLAVELRPQLDLAPPVKKSAPRTRAR